MQWIKDNWVPVLIVAIVAVATIFFLRDLGVFTNSNQKEVEEMRQEHAVLKAQYEAQRQQIQRLRQELEQQDERYEQDKVRQRVELKKLKQQYEDLLQKRRGIDSVLPPRPTWAQPVYQG